VASIPVVDPEVDPYAVLGVSRGATTDEIKRAYRTRAKSAHPDAGGSPEAMDRVNRAYHLLSDAAAKREFDRHRDVQADATAATARTSTRRASEPAAAPETGQGVTPTKRRMQARSYVWSQLEEFGWAAALAGLALSFLATRAIGPAAWLLGLGGFALIYWLVLQLVYIAVPELKLITFDTVRSLRRSSPRHRRILLIVSALWIPLGLIWAALCAWFGGK